MIGGERGGNVRGRADQNLFAGFEFQRGDSKLESRRPAAECDSKLAPAIIGERLFKVWNRFAKRARDFTASNRLGDRRDLFFADIRLKNGNHYLRGDE